MAVIKGLSGPEFDRLKKNVVKTVKDCGLTAEIDEETTIWFDIWFKPAHRDPLIKSGFQEKFSYTSAQNKNYKNDKQRKRKIIWNNPPYSANVKTNIGKTFLDFFRKHFSKTNKLHKIFNKNAVKISYSYMSNISII